LTPSELDRRFPTDDACLEFLKERAFPNGSPCPSCGKGSRFHRIAGRSAFSCQFCGRHVYPTAGTIFHKSRTSLRLWFRAIELVRTSGDRLTARALERELGVSYKTALRMHRQIRALLEEDPDPLAGSDGVGTRERFRLSPGRSNTRNRAVSGSRVGRGVDRVSRQPRRRRGGGMSKRFELRNPAHRRYALRAFVAAAIVAGAALGVSQARVSEHHQARLNSPHFMRVGEGQFATSLNAVRTGEPAGLDGLNQEIYSNQAYPALTIAPAQRQTAATAAQRIRGKKAKKGGGWTVVGPEGVPASATVAGESTAGTSGTVFSGRTTALAVSPACTSKKCPMLLGAAGGGVWATDNAMGKKVKWAPSNGSIPSNAVGSIAFDPNDTTGQTVYVGTGEPNGSSDSEAGVGLYKSLDGGQTWTRVFGSVAPTAPCADNPSSLTCSVATGRSIGAIAVDPADPDHIFIGTDVARHGSSSVNGGRFTPPGSAQVGLYESTDGGATFAPGQILPQDVVDPTTANGSDFFRGGASDIEIDAATGDVYAAFFDYGVYRNSGSGWEQIFASAGGGTVGNSSFSRTEFSLAPDGADLGIYVGDTGDGGTADFYTVANARGVPAATLLTGWVTKSDPTNGTPGFGSYNYCVGQCSYDMPVYSPPGFPHVVYIGGAMQYDEIFGGDPVPFRSNGRAIQRSEDDATNFTDMTIDSKGVSLHPDQHVITGVPFSPDVVFIGNDGGIWRLDGSFVDASANCATKADQSDVPFTPADTTDCQNWLSKIPKTITALNNGLSTLQFQSLSTSAKSPKDIQGGTQDNGTQATTNGKKWSVTIFGDGGQSGINVANPKIRMHTFYSPNGDVNFQGNKETGWDFMAGPLLGSGEGASFYVPLISDPNAAAANTWFVGLQHVWRTQDNAGSQAQLDTQCNEFTGTGPFDTTCGDWEPLGPDLTDAALNDGAPKNPGPSGYVVATERAPSDTSTLWVGLRRGRVFVSKNADDTTAANVTFDRIDGPTTNVPTPTPTRFVSGIAVDPVNPNHAFVSFSGYNAYANTAGTAPGHVFDVLYDPVAHTATWKNIDYDLGDQPITDIALDTNGDLYASTDFGVDVLSKGTTAWVPASTGLPSVAVYGLTIDRAHRVLLAATHGRSAWQLTLS
jgi:transposase-like protein